MGMSSLRYQLEHSWHHNWPNCPAGEIEQSFAYAPGMRHFTWQPRRCFHRFQWLYWPLSFCLVLLQVAITDVTGFFIKGRMGALTAKLCWSLALRGPSSQPLRVCTRSLGTTMLATSSRFSQIGSRALSG